VDVIVGCFSMIRRAAFDDVGLLDEDLFMYGDDVDWCRRAQNAGWQVVFYPGAQAIHDRGKTTAPFPAHFAVAQQRSVLHYWTKHHTFFGVLGIRSIMLLHHLVRYTVVALSDLARSKKSAQSEVRKQVSGACLRQLLYGAVPSKPEEQLAS
ncbi:MAG: glycosyltransferase family 2 protein, partial [Candidatus Sulfotelmatobacter sp.]